MFINHNESTAFLLFHLCLVPFRCCYGLLCFTIHRQLTCFCSGAINGRGMGETGHRCLGKAMPLPPPPSLWIIRNPSLPPFGSLNSLNSSMKQTIQSSVSSSLPLITSHFLTLFSPRGKKEIRKKYIITVFSQKTKQNTKDWEEIRDHGQ